MLTIAWLLLRWFKNLSAGILGPYDTVITLYFISIDYIAFILFQIWWNVDGRK